MWRNWRTNEDLRGGVQIREDELLQDMKSCWEREERGMNTCRRRWSRKYQNLVRHVASQLRKMKGENLLFACCYDSRRSDVWTLSVSKEIDGSSNYNSWRKFIDCSLTSFGAGKTSFCTSNSTKNQVPVLAMFFRRFLLHPRYCLGIASLMFLAAAPES